MMVSKCSGHALFPPFYKTLESYKGHFTEYERKIIFLAVA